MGLGVFNQGLTGDTSQINYSAARFGELLQRNRVKSLQNKLIETVVLPILKHIYAIIPRVVLFRFVLLQSRILSRTLLLFVRVLSPSMLLKM